MRKQTFIISILLILVNSSIFAWWDWTHLAIAKAAGIKRYYTAVSPDIVKLKFYDENPNHYFHPEKNEKITINTIKEQIDKYDRSDDRERGHLPGSIIASYRKYLETKDPSKRRYLSGFVAHYAGDLSNPFHIIEYDDFNKLHHLVNDGIVDDEIMENLDKIKIKEIVFKNEEDIMEEIVRITEKTRQLGYKLKKENRDMTEEEAYNQISMSVSLLKAMIEYANTKFPVYIITKGNREKKIQVKEKPDISSTTITEVTGNTILKLIEKKDHWTLIELPDTRKGYIKKEFIEEE